MKKVLVIGSPNSIHTMNFINLVLIKGYKPDRIDLFSVDHGHDIKKEYVDFYIRNNINIHCSDVKKTSNKILRKLLYLFTKTYELKKFVNNMKYDYCFILYCSWYNALWGFLFKSKFSRLIPVFWGGDVLRNTKLLSFAFSKMLASSFRIIMPNLNSQRIFNEKTKSKYREKTLVIQYPQKMVSMLIDTEKKGDPQEYKKAFGLPNNKIIIICGHTATRAENYLEIIKQLDLCKTEILNNCYFVFMMTYAPEEYKSYQQEVIACLEKSKLHGVVFTDFIPYQDVLKLHFAGDIHITAIKTDALSCFLQEELYSGSVLLYGKWLNYFELENDEFSVIPFNQITELSDVFSDVIVHFKDYQDKARINRNGIFKLASEDSILSDWITKVFDAQF